MKNPLLDKDFLYKLNQYKHKDIYVKIISLSFDEQPLEQIEGKVTSGSVNIDGASAIRRTCNLSLVAKDINVTDFYWGVSNKFSLEVGVTNEIDSKYPDIIWFKQGIFVITSFNSSLAQNNCTISISGKDKMCLLNGDVGGNLPASVDFGKIDTQVKTYTKVTIEDYTQYTANTYYVKENNEYVLSTAPYNATTDYYVQDILLEQESLALKDIIKEMVHTYGKEMYHNIVIKDLDNYGLELLEYRGDIPLYLLYNEDTAVYDNMVIDDKFQVYKELTPEKYEYTPENNLSLLSFTQNPLKYFLYDEKEDIFYQRENFQAGKQYYTRQLIPATISSEPVSIKDIEVFNNAVDNFNDSRTFFYLNNSIEYDEKEVRITSRYSATQIEYGQAAGYRTTDLTYAGDLISSIGESVTSILDKIKGMLGLFEYFYDLDGRFIFQKKPSRVSLSWNSLIESDGNVFARDAVEESTYAYSFEDVNLIQKFQNTPAINNVKNDYSVWGVRDSIDGAKIPIHARYAIHKKPLYYKSFDGCIYYSSKAVLEEVKETEKGKLLIEIINRVQSFTPQYGTRAGLTPPMKNEDGSWTPGWWDIRDWHDYYYAIRQEEPRGTMKWYSYNDVTGCQRVKDALPNYTGFYENSYTWLMIVDKNGDVQLGHGSGDPHKPEQGRMCTYYESYIREDGYLVTETVVPKIEKYFIPPYSGCSDWHTYLDFLKRDVERAGGTVYFYNPNFPGMSSYEETLETEVEKEFNEMIEQGKLRFVDWREIIYRMALDYFKHNQEVDFLYQVHHNNLKADGISSHYPSGHTGYETFYTDMQGYWRQLYDTNPKLNYTTTGGYYSEIKYYKAPTSLTAEQYKKNQLNYFILVDSKYVSCQGKTFVAGTQYYTDNVELREGDTYRVQTSWIPFEQSETEYTCDYFLREDENNPKINQDYWHKNVVESPEALNFWIDFYEGGDELSQYSIDAIGDRSKVVNNTKVSSIYHRNVPQIIYTNAEDYDALDIKSGYVYVWLPQEMQNLFSISAQGKSAEEEIQELFNQHSYCSENISITTIPIYHLEPNTLAYIRNEQNYINGKYEISKISVPLAYNGTMSITATKVVNQTY